MNRCIQLLLVVSILLLGTAVWATAAANSQQGDDADTATASETWGGENVRLQMYAQGATVEFPCANGVITEPIKADVHGAFSVRGTYTPGQFGPIRKDNPPQELSATYKGTIANDTMHLQVVLEKKEIQPPMLTLTKGNSGHVVRCH